MDEEAEIEFTLASMDLPRGDGQEDFRHEQGIPPLPVMKTAVVCKPYLLIQNVNNGYQMQDLGLSVVMDKTLRKVGIWLPEHVRLRD